MIDLLFFLGSLAPRGLQHVRGFGGVKFPGCCHRWGGGGGG